MKKNSLIQVPLDSRTKEELESIADRDEKSLAAVVRTAIKVYLRIEKVDSKRQDKYKYGDLWPSMK